MPCPTTGLPTVAMVEEHAAKAGFNLARRQEIGPHYVKTLQLWADALEAHREQAIAAQSQEVYDRYVKYLAGCQGLFRDGYTSVNQFTLQK
jgi:cyclopropane fatty-acyl-phospholipid synthase-like methyltransferase